MAQMQDITSPMTKLEKRATFSLASIYAMRMLGLFMLLPVLSLFAEQLDAATPLLIGLSISIYGLSQALLQIPFGLLSDRFGRKKIIVLGLFLFAAGSVVAAMATTIYGVLLGRAIQGAGAIAAAIMAMLADLTQEVHRTKAMATIGMSIGISFAIAITLGPIVAATVGVSGIFWITAGLALLAIIVIIWLVPTPENSIVHCDAELIPAQFGKVLKNPDLLRLDFGIFVLHLCLTASFVVVPVLIKEIGIAPVDHWQVYLPILFSTFLFIVPFVILAEKKRQMKKVFLGSIFILMLAFVGLFLVSNLVIGLIASLWLFFCGFNLLEATLPSLVSKTAPGDFKGTAMGAYSSSQFIGAFVGGLGGGWIYGEYGLESVFLFCEGAVFLWFIVACFMKTPRYLANVLISLEQVSVDQGQSFVVALLAIQGVKEAKLHFEESVAYLKVDNQQLDKADLQHFLDSWSDSTPGSI